MTQFTAMKTQEGNAMVQRIVNAAADLYLLQGASWAEVVTFLDRKLSVLATCVDFAEAGTSLVRLEANYAVQCQVARRADEVMA